MTLIAIAGILGGLTAVFPETGELSDAAKLREQRSRANMFTIARWTLVFQGVEGRDPASLRELLSVPYSPFPGGHFVNPYTGGPVEEWDAELVWTLLERNGILRRYGSREKFLGPRDLVVGNVPPLIPQYGTVTYMGRGIWALATDPDGSGSKVRLLLWSHPPESPRPDEREGPFSPAEVKAGVDLQGGKRVVKITYRKWFSWITDPSERKVIFLCREMDLAFGLYTRNIGLSGLPPSDWKNALQKIYDAGLLNLTSPVNPYAGREMRLSPYSEHSPGDFWFYDRSNARKTLKSEQPLLQKHFPGVLCYGKGRKILYPPPNTVWDLLWRAGELEAPRPPKWWFKSVQQE